MDFTWISIVRLVGFSWKWAYGRSTPGPPWGQSALPGAIPGILHIECSTFTASSFRIWNSSTGILSLPGASVRNSARGKGHEEGGLAYAKAGSSLKSPPGNSQASTPKTRVCLLCFVLSPTPLTLWGVVPHYLSLKKELTDSSSLSSWV